MLQTKDPLMKMKDMCADSGYTKQHFYNQIKQGKLAKPIKYGRDSRWPLSEYEKWKRQTGHQA